MASLTVLTALLTAEGKPGQAMRLALGMLPISIVLNLLLVPLLRPAGRRLVHGRRHLRRLFGQLPLCPTRLWRRGLWPLDGGHPGCRPDQWRPAILWHPGRIHENTKVELKVYARENGKPTVKPFMLVIARDTDHSNALVTTIEDESFFEGRYKGLPGKPKVIQVHSKQSGDERDETIEQLINVENPDNPTEIVIHVNMLKEGWDVTNLYTIVPLRAANSKTLVEQSIGRGLRLPYGKRTGVGAVDRLTIVSHDKFQEIVDYANSPDSVIRGGLKVLYVNDERSKVVICRTGDCEQDRGGRCSLWNARGRGTAEVVLREPEGTGGGEGDTGCHPP